MSPRGHISNVSLSENQISCNCTSFSCVSYPLESAQIHENSFEPERDIKRKLPDHLWIIKVTYLTVGTKNNTRMLSVYKLESVFNLTTPSFLSSCEDLDESDKVLVMFALTLKTAMLVDGLWAIKVTNLIVGAKTFREVSSKDRSLAHSKIFI